MIDPSIPLAIKPPQFADPLEQQGKVMNLLAMRQQIQMAPLHQQALQQQIQAGTLENQQRQLDLEDQQKYRQAWMDAGGDPDKTFDLATKRGVGPKLIMSAKESLLKIASEKAGLDEKTLTNNASKNDQLNALLQPVVAEPDPSKQQALWSQQLQAGVQKKLLTPEEAAQHQQYPGPDGVKQYVAGLATDKWLTAQGAALRGQAAADNSKREADLQPFKVAEGQAKQDQIDRENFARQNPNDPAAQQAALTAQQRAEKAQKDREFAESLRSHLSNEATAKLMASVSAGRLAQEQMVNGMKYGPGTTEYWVKQLQDSPDSIKEMPAELRSNVGKGFTAATGLPLPTPVGEAAKTQETAARNALDGAAFIQEALKNPEIRANLGPIMGRLGNAEQALGTAPNLSPEASRIAQELRTRLRYFVFQEGKAVLGGRLPANLMKQLEESSPNPKMDPDMLAGALKGAIGNATTVMDNVERQRFGGKMRPGGMRSGGSGQQSNGPAHPSAGTVQDGYRFKGGDASKAENWEKVN